MQRTRARDVALPTVPTARRIANAFVSLSTIGLVAAWLAPSFPASPALLRIPIDHVLTSCNVGIADRRIERDVGSDHLPVVVDLVVPPGE